MKGIEIFFSLSILFHLTEKRYSRRCIRHRISKSQIIFSLLDRLK